MNATMTTSTMKATAAMSANAFVSAVVVGSEQIIGQESFIQSTGCEHTNNEGKDCADKSNPPGDRVS